MPNDLTMHFFADCGLLGHDGIPTACAMEYAGRIHAKPLFLAHEAVDSLEWLFQAKFLMDEYGKSRDASALRTLLNSLYDSTELEPPCAFAYFDGFPRAEQNILAFCEGLAPRLDQLFCGEEELE